MFLLFFSKKKYYDGSSNLKMIGNDCKLLELNIDVFLDSFLNKDKGETWQSPTATKLRQVLSLYQLFSDLARCISCFSLFLSAVIFVQ